MRTSSFLVLFFACLTSQAHDKHISLVTVSDGAGRGRVQLSVKMSQPDYLSCSAAGKDGFAQWLRQQLIVSGGSGAADLQMVQLIWGNEIKALFVAQIGDSAASVKLRSTLLTSCIPSHKTIVTAQLNGDNYGQILTVQTDSCVFPLRK